MKDQNKSLEIINSFCDKCSPSCALVMGSGLKFPSSEFSGEVIEIPYANIPGFPVTSVEGHSGTLKLVSSESGSCVVFAGRFHLYEGHPLEKVVYPVEFANSLGISDIVLTNSAGGLNPYLRVGDVVALFDYLLLFDLGLTESNSGKIEAVEKREASLFESIKAAGSSSGVDLKKGTYAYMPGPAYETPAEVKMLRSLGAYVVGMSTVPEWQAAQRLGMNIGALSMVTNVHSENSDPPSHEEVLEAAEEGGMKMVSILNEIVFGNE